MEKDLSVEKYTNIWLTDIKCKKYAIFGLKTPIFEKNSEKNKCWRIYRKFRLQIVQFAYTLFLSFCCPIFVFFKKRVNLNYLKKAPICV